MKRCLLPFAIFFAGWQSLCAQAYEGKIEYQKIVHLAAITEEPYQSNVVEEAIKDYMAKNGFKSYGSNGFILFKGVKLANSDTASSDLYFKIDHKSRNEKDVTVIGLLPTKANENPISKSPSEDSKVEEAKSLLDHLRPFIDAYYLNLQVSEQENVVKKLHKKHDNLADDQANLEKRIRKLQTELDQNKIDQQKQSNLMQQDVNQDQVALQKEHKKMDHLLNDQGDLEKKLRKSQSELEQNKKDQDNLKEELGKQQQVLDSLKGKQKPAGS